MIKRILSFILAVVLLTGALPQKEANAAIIPTMRLTTGTGVSGNFYDTVFQFNALNDSAVVRYRMDFRNISGTNVGGYTNGGTTSAGVSDPVEITASLELLPGSLYEFRIVPVYEQFYPEGSPNAGMAYYVDGAVIAQYVALTNIRVSAVGSGNTMEVTFDLPTLRGGHFFNEYNIYYANIDNSQNMLSWSVNPERVLVDRLSISEGKATYSFTNSQDFIAGRIFAVKVEPVYGTVERIQLSGTQSFGSMGSFIFTSDYNKEYLADNAYIRPWIQATVSTVDKIDITWESLANKPLSGRIERIELWCRTVDALGNSNSSLITTFSSTGISAAQFYSANIPNAPYAEYYIVATYSNISYRQKDNTMKAPYSVTVESLRAIYAPEALEFAPYRPDIYSIADNAATPLQLTINWRGFLRDPFTEAEKSPLSLYNGHQFFDRDVTYYIYITDDPNNFDLMNENQAYVIYGSNEALEIVDIDGKPYFVNTFPSYYRRGTSNFISETFEQNKIYYVKIEAVRNATAEKATPATAAHYIMPIDKVPTEPSMLARPPLRIKTEMGAEVITETTITIEWDEQWIEIFKPGDTPEEDRWYSKIGVVNGVLVYDDSDAIKNANNILQNRRSLTEDGKINKDVSFQEIINYLNEQNLLAPGEIPVLRLVDITGSSYKLHTAEYNTVAAAGYESYFDEISKAGTAAVWDTITHTATGPITMEAVVNISHNPASSPLTPGTPYLIFLRPFVVGPTGDKLAFYPAYVSSTTLKGREPIVISPVVPVIEWVSSTDTSVTVRFEYIGALTYEMRFSSLFNAYDQGGVVIDNDTIMATGRPFTDPENNKMYLVFEIIDLYPSTRYYVWMRSHSETEPSGWSNPVEGSTKEMNAPKAPAGLGLASEFSINVYNQSAGTGFFPASSDYIVTEFLRIDDDMYYSLLQENTISAAAATGDSLAQYLANPDVPESYLAKFNSLVSNRLYYIRAKTRLVLTREGEGIGSRLYSYIVELSVDQSFTDVTTIEIPAASDTASGLWKESDWVYVSLFTGISTAEYDGDKNPDNYPLPFADYEIIYDSKTSTLTYRFRSNGTGADGSKDNGVDERFVSRLVANRIFTYQMDLSKYNNILPYNRVVEFPYNIIAAFNERKISLTLKADNFTVTFEPGTLITNETISIGGLDKNAKMRITLNANPNGLPVGDNYLSAPHKLSATLQTTARVVNIVNYAKPVRMNMALSGNYVESATNIGAYVIDDNSGGWQRLATAFDTITKSINFASQKSAVYAAIGIITPGAVQGATLGAMYRANSKLSITDMGVYNENAAVTVNQFNQIIAASLSNVPSVNMNVPLTQQSSTALAKAGLLVSGGGTVSREAGYASLVKLYELKSKMPVTGYPRITETSYTDIQNAAMEYQTALLKAEELGFFRTASANPKNGLTFGDLMYVLDVVLNY